MAESSPVRERWLPLDVAAREVVAFERRFGPGHLALACHAALPLLLTPELLNLIHLNFLEEENIPWVAEADLLLSALCRPIDEGLYEVEPGIREVLLAELEEQFGWQRPQEIAGFLLSYLAKRPTWHSQAEATNTVRWIARAYLEPDAVVQELTTLLDKNLEGLEEEDGPALNLPISLQLAHLNELLAEPLEQTTFRESYQDLSNNIYILSHWVYGESPAVEIDEGGDMRAETGVSSAAIRPVIQKFVKRRKTSARSEETSPLKESEIPQLQWEGTEMGKVAVPFQAPPASPLFVGREREIEGIREFLTKSPGPNICCIVGMGGTGKTVLATYIAHRLRSDFPDGVLWANGAIQETSDILEAWSHPFGYDFVEHPTLGSLRRFWQNILATKKILIILDDVQSAEWVQPLLPLGSQGAALLTTRDRSIAPRGAYIYDLSRLPPLASRELVSNILGRVLSPEEEVCADEISNLLGHLPLAIEIAAKSLLRNPSLTVCGLLERLQNSLAEVGDRNVQNAFSLAFQSLSSALKQSFILLCRFTRPFTLDEFASLAGLERDIAEEHLYRLVNYSLLSVSEDNPAHFYHHPLLADFVRTLLEEQRPEEQMLYEFLLQLTTLPKNQVAGEIHTFVDRWRLLEISGPYKQRIAQAIVEKIREAKREKQSQDKGWYLELKASAEGPSI
ncbi:MAG: hypothetical protein H0T73_22795 [Ardenticatenales bacterium]|nr:hypothetical protein [Ardenticatenales bacterium]